MMCNLCDGTDPNKCAYASTCSICEKKYFGNGYNETKLPCPDCLKKGLAASISKSLWYLVRKDRETKPWTFYVLTPSFKTATQADVYAELKLLHGYHPTHGYAIIQHQEDEAVGLAHIVYMDLAAPKVD